MEFMGRLAIYIVFLILYPFVSFTAGLPPPEGQPTHADVAGLGRIHGITYLLPNGSVDAFLGIPFAKPPVGELRFRPPVPLDGPWRAEYNATRRPTICYQKSVQTRMGDLWWSRADMNEDCLYLNVWKPTHVVGNKAVMIWIHGGGFHSGDSTLALYDGSILSALGDVVVVSIQYRLGPLGFLAFGDPSAPGNAGLLDQQLALTWVHQHIAAFGGDPDRVTLFGESAGAVSVSYHLLSPGSKNLFRSAIMQSGVANGPENAVSRETIEQRSRELSQLLNCPQTSKLETLNCLRNKTAGEVTDTQWKVHYTGPKVKSPIRPIIDGSSVQDDAIRQLNSGDCLIKDILLGVNKNEGSLFIPLMFPVHFNLSRDLNPGSTNADQYRQMIRDMEILSNPHDAVVNALAFEYEMPCEFNGTDSPTYFSALDNLYGDYQYKCPTVKFALSYARKCSDYNTSAYFYSFNHRSSANPLPSWSGDVPHLFEIDHVFGRPWDPTFISMYTDEERVLSYRMIQYWTNFAKTGDPNLDEVREQISPDNVWPKYTSTERLVLVLDTKDKLDTQTGLRDRSCQFWDNILSQLQDAIGACDKDVGVRNHCTYLLPMTFAFLIALLLRFS